MAVLAAEAAAQVDIGPPGSSAAVPALAPLVILGQTLGTELPVGTTVTTRQHMDERGIESWEDFSKRGEPGVNFNADNQSINIRGMDQDRVVTRVDGIRIPWLDDGARGEKGGLGSIDFNSLSSIDLVRAAGSTQSGSLVGYLDVRTLSPDDLLAPGKDFGALLKSGYDGSDDSWGADAALAGRLGNGNTSWLLQAGQRDGHAMDNKGEVGGYGAKREKANPQDYTQQNMMLKLQHAWNEEHKVVLSGEHFKRTGTIDNRREQGDGTSYLLGKNSTEQELLRERVALGYEFRSAHNKAALDQGELKLYWQRSRLAGDQNGTRVGDSRGSIIRGDPFRYGFPSGAFGRNNTVQESGFGVISQLGGYVNGAAVQQHWMAGAEWDGNRTEQSSSGYDNCPAVQPGLPAPFGPRACDLLHTNQADAPNAKGQQWALWAQDEFSWADGKYALTPALRFDAYRQTPQTGGAYASNPNASVTPLSSASGQRLSPSLLGTYKALDNLSFYAKYGYGYKAPSATQLYTNYGAPGTYLRAGNPNLKAEVSRGWELGMDAGSKDLGGRLALFDNRYRDYIDEGVAITTDSPEWNPAWAGQYPLGVTSFVNRPNVRIYGAELSAHWNIDSNWYTWGSLAWTRGRDQDTGRHLNSVAPLKIITAVGYRTQQWGAQAIATAVKRRTEVEYPDATSDTPADFQAPGYGLLDLMAWWKPPVVKGLRVQAGVYNVFDKKYWNALDVPRAGGRETVPIDGYTQPGRNVRVSLTYQY